MLLRSGMKAAPCHSTDVVLMLDPEEVLDDVRAAEAECAAANVEENDYTIFTTQDLEFELELLRQSVQKKIAFIDNQVGWGFVTAERLHRVTQGSVVFV